MVRFNTILNKLNIKYERKNKKNGKIRLYLCEYPVSEGSTIPFVIIINKIVNTFSLYTIPLWEIDDKMKNESLEAINNLNSEIVFGTYYIDKKNKVRYYIGVSLEGDNSINEEQVKDYTSAMIEAIKAAMNDLKKFEKDKQGVIDLDDKRFIISCSFVIAFIILRLFLLINADDAVTLRIMSAINSIAFSYVIYDIYEKSYLQMKKMEENIKKRVTGYDKHINISVKKFNNKKGYLITIIFVFILLYTLIGGCNAFNDILTIIALLFSIEDDVIAKKFTIIFINARCILYSFSFLK